MKKEFIEKLKEEIQRIKKFHGKIIDFQKIISIIEKIKNELKNAGFNKVEIEPLISINYSMDRYMEIKKFFLMGKIKLAENKYKDFEINIDNNKIRFQDETSYQKRYKNVSLKLFIKKLKEIQEVALKDEEDKIKKQKILNKIIEKIQKINPYISKKILKNNQNSYIAANEINFNFSVYDVIVNELKENHKKPLTKEQKRKLKELNIDIKDENIEIIYLKNNSIIVKEKNEIGGPKIIKQNAELDDFIKENYYKDIYFYIDTSKNNFNTSHVFFKELSKKEYLLVHKELEKISNIILEILEQEYKTKFSVPENIKNNEEVIISNIIRNNKDEEYKINLSHISIKDFEELNKLILKKLNIKQTQEINYNMI